MMDWKRVAVLTGAIVLGGAGCSAAAPKTAATGTAPATATTAATGNTHLMVYSVNSDGPRLQAIVSGAIGDYGPAVTVLPDGAVDPTHEHDLQLTLTHGSFRLSITSLIRKFTQAASHEPIYPRTCSDFFGSTASVPVVPGSGTGAYRGIRGSFEVTLTANEVEKTPCQQASAFQWQLLTLAGTGSVSSGLR
jgi:hypothetical protein